jgi:CRISPR-associated protein Cas2
MNRGLTAPEPPFDDPSDSLTGAEAVTPTAAQEEKRALDAQPPRSDTSANQREPFQLQPSTAAEPRRRRRSRGRQGRDPVASKYRMTWVLVFFDLPVGTAEERKAAANFRKDLLKEGYIMVQFSVYARPCGSADRVETQVRRLKPKIPPKGEVRSLIISDAQWGRMLVMRSQQKAESEKQPEQMMFF